MEVAVLLYDGVSAGEALAPWAVLRRVPGATCRFVAEQPRRHRAHGPAVRLDAPHTLDEVGWADVVVVPGGFGCRRLAGNEALLGWIRELHAASQWTAGVSTGSVLLAAAGLLDGREATTHWLARDLLEVFGAVPVRDRFVRSGRVLTAMGTSAAIDMALWVAAHSAGGVAMREVDDELAAELDALLDPQRARAAEALVMRWQRDGEPEELPAYVPSSIATRRGRR